MAPTFWEMQLQKKEERLARSVRQVGTLTSGAAGTRLSQFTNDSNQGANARSRNPSPNAGRVHTANDEGQLTSKRKFMDENTGNSFGNVGLRIHQNAEGSRTDSIHLDSENSSNTSGSVTILNQESYRRNNTRNVRSRQSSPGRPTANATPPQSTQSVGFSRGASSRPLNPSNGIPIEMGFTVLAEAVRQLSEEMLEREMRAQQLSQLSRQDVSVYGGSGQTALHDPVHIMFSETNVGASIPIGHTWGSCFPSYSGLSTVEILRNTAIDGKIVCPFVISSLSPTLFIDDPWPMPVSGINGEGSNYASFNNHQSLPISDAGTSHNPITVSGINPILLPSFSHLPTPVSAVHDQVRHLFSHFEHETIEETLPMLMTAPVSSVQINPVSGTNVQGITRRRWGRGSGTVNSLLSPAAAGNSQNISEEMGVLDYFSEVDFEIEDDALRDMRLDVDNMSYEELLELGEQIGNVNIGLTEKAAKKRMKLRKFVPKKKETEPCCICQDDYKKGDKLGSLKTCGHTFHPDCIKQWLMVKDSCPICKTATSGASK